jgi:hypothetical protein
MKSPCDNFLSPSLQPLDVYTGRTDQARRALGDSAQHGFTGRIVGQAGKEFPE